MRAWLRGNKSPHGSRLTCCEFCWWSWPPLKLYALWMAGLSSSCAVGDGVRSDASPTPPRVICANSLSMS